VFSYRTIEMFAQSPTERVQVWHRVGGSEEGAARGREFPDQVGIELGRTRTQMNPNSDCGVLVL
jgi:hypothetical protein